ncbi:MAG: hypothetical protein GY705_13225 [Bacteroidetes bacterium]|nr:hypothetical protein [Bacteroidota bacterium]
MDKKEKSLQKKIIQAIALFLLLVVLPGGSWFYLRSGLNYHLDSLEALQDFGKPAEASIVAQNGEPFSSDWLLEKISLIGRWEPEMESTFPEVLLRLKKLQRQFDERKDVLFLLYNADADSSTTADFAKRNGLDDGKQILFLSGDEVEIKKFAESVFHSALTDGKNWKNHSFFAFVDVEGTVRNCYDMQDAEEVKKFIEHIALLLPREAEKDIIFEREKEM